MIFGRIIQCTLITKLARRISVSDPHAVNSALVSSGENNKHPLTNCRWLIKTMASGTGATNELKTQNRLGFERSPYLLQHASNPVDWYPWGEEAFEKARKEDKLIFLSVGYSTCHWCHVMERESFENDEIAKVMNEHFINIKVDREERPDVDRMYMSFVQATSGGGGWPMSVWLTPDLMPVYGGTYYPPDERYIGQPGFKTLLNIISSQWHENRTKFTQLGARVTDVLRKTSLMDIQEDKATAYFECAEKCLKQLTDAYESCYGGFSNAPKFPQAPNMEFLFHEYARDPNSPQGEKARDMCLHTLRMMAKGGIHDHVAQGFARYSTDNHWHVPHFEKMLYDQAQLVVAYTNAYVATKDDLFAEIVHDILLYVNRDLGHKEGGFYSAEDADSYPSEEASEKREGAFCVWTHSEIKEHLSKQIPSHEPLTQAEVFSFHFNVKPEGNVDPHKDPHGELRGQNVLIVYGSEEKTAEKFRIPVDVVRQTLKESCKILFEVRQKRPKPHLDDKIITAWNALMISGFAKAGEALGEKDYVKRAEQTATFIKKYLYDEKTGNLLRSCYKGKEKEIVQIAHPISGFLCDYTYLIRGLLDLYEASLNSEWLEWAEQLQEHQDKLFWDSEANGYFTSAAGDSSLLFRIKEEQDGAEPAGNAVAASNLQRMASMLDRPDLREKARGILAAFAPWLKRAPASLPVMCVAARVLREGPTAIVVSGAAEEPATAALLAVVRNRLLPGRVLSLADGRGLLHDRCEPVRRMAEKPARAYVCRRKACSLPVADPEVLEKLLDARELATPPGSPRNDRR